MIISLLFKYQVSELISSLSLTISLISICNKTDVRGKESGKQERTKIQGVLLLGTIHQGKVYKESDQCRP